MKPFYLILSLLTCSILHCHLAKSMAQSRCDTLTAQAMLKTSNIRALSKAPLQHIFWAGTSQEKPQFEVPANKCFKSFNLGKYISMTPDSKSHQLCVASPACAKVSMRLSMSVLDTHLASLHARTPRTSECNQENSTIQKLSGQPPNTRNT